MKVFTLSDPFTDEVKYVGKTESVFPCLGNMMLRPAPAYAGWFAELEAAKFFPVVAVYETDDPDGLKRRLLAKHSASVLNKRIGGKRKTKAEIAAEYSARLRARLRKMGVSIGKLCTPRMVERLRERGERYASRV